MKSWLIIREGHSTVQVANLAAAKHEICRRSLQRKGKELYTACEFTESDGIRHKHTIWIATPESAKINGFERALAVEREPESGG